MALDPGIHVALCAAIETAINSALRYDPGSHYALARLHGKVLAVELTQPSLNFYFSPEADGVRIQSTFDGELSTRIKGSPMALLALTKSTRLNLADSGVEAFGDTGLLIELQGIIKNLDIDWEEAVSSVIGDIAGHQLGNGIHALKQWAKGRKQTFERLLGEFVTEEIRASPNKNELEQFYQQVDELRLGLDRASAKVAQLLAKNPANIDHNSVDHNSVVHNNVDHNKDVR